MIIRDELGNPAVNCIHVADAMKLLGNMPAQSVDCIVTDPPYGIGLDTWDKPIDIPAFLKETQRVLKLNGFFAFTMQMPHMVDWLVELRCLKFRYREHIAWVKRKNTTAMLDINRAWESILIYGSGEFQQTSGRFEDVKLPGLLTQTYTFDGLDRYISNLRLQANGKPSPMRRAGHKHHKAHSYMPIQDGNRSPETVNFTNVWSFLPENMSHLNNADHMHASVKPLKMFERLVELLTKPGDLVLDPYCGSGTTALAARNTGRLWICGDTSPEYVAIARQRLDAPFTPNMFEQVAPPPMPVAVPLFAGL